MFGSKRIAELESENQRLKQELQTARQEVETYRLAQHDLQTTSLNEPEDTSKEELLSILLGSYELNEASSHVKFSRVASTMMACPRLRDESAFLKALEKVESYSIEEGVLLLQKEGKTVATFEAVYQP